LSDCNTPFLKSNVAESVTVFGSPDASVGSVYSTVIISPCSKQKLVPANTGATLNLCCTFPLVAFVADKYEPVGGHIVLAGPSVYLIEASSSNIPASGAISVSGPNSLVSRLIVFPTVIVLPAASGPPAVPSTIDC